MDVVKSVVTLKDIRGQTVRPLPFRLQGRGYKDRPHAEQHNTLTLDLIREGYTNITDQEIQGQRTMTPHLSRAGTRGQDVKRHGPDSVNIQIPEGHGGGVKAEKPDDILVPINCEKTKTTLLNGKIDTLTID